MTAYSCVFPQSNFPGNYSVVEGHTEGMSSSGAEASVTYIGDWGYRFAFLNEWFGLWSVTRDETPGEEPSDPPVVTNCATLESVPAPYPSILGTGDCLYADTYTLRQCGPPDLIGAPAQADSLKPIGGCAAEITINFRHKWHATWPHRYHPTNLCRKDSGDPLEVDYTTMFPDIPDGTFLQVRDRVEVANRTIPGREVTLQAFSAFDPVDESNCEKQLVRANDTFVDAPSLSQPEQEFGIPVTTTVTEVTWSNVPIVPEASIASLRGKVCGNYFMARPRGSTLFAGAEVIPRGTWACDELCDVVYTFITKTVPFTCGNATANGTVGAACGQIGFWNRDWDSCITAFSEECCTHWKDVVFQNDCGSGDKAFEETASFAELFSFDMCPVA